MFKLILKILMIFLLSYTTLAYSGNYKGEKVSLVFKDADLKNVLMLFAEYENKNFLIDEDVKGTITIRLKNVPWDQALKIILNMKNLEKIEDGNVVRIVSKEYIQKKQDEKKRKELEKIKEKERKKEQQKQKAQNQKKQPISNMEERKWQKMLNQRGVRTLMLPIKKGEKNDNSKPW